MFLKRRRGGEENREGRRRNADGEEVDEDGEKRRMWKGMKEGIRRKMDGGRRRKK